jgi:hypothetical protein
LNEITLVTLQSGFVAVSSKHLAKSDKSSFTRLNIDTMLFSVPKERIYDPNSYCSVVNDLYRRWLGNPLIIKDPKFEDAIVRAAKEAFGLTSIFDWFRLQDNAPNLSPLHTEFLKQTLLYVAASKRQVPNVTWISLLEQDDAKPRNMNVTFDPSAYFTMSDSDWSNPNMITHLPMDIHSFLGRWISKNGGCGDLLTSLQIIFGEKRHIKVM